jgi:hypothetical protein
MKKVKSSNELIAVYMEFVLYQDSTYRVDLPKYAGFCSPKKLRFDSSWDWLMPVVEKISFSLEHCEHKINIKNCLLACNLESVYLEIIKFIKWHNERL